MCFKRKKKVQEQISDAFSGIAYYILIDNTIFGPFSLDEMKQYPLLEDTLITTNTLDGDWHEARYFECFSDLFRNLYEYRIAEDGTIIR